MAPNAQTETSSYMQTLTRYLSNIMNSTLLGLPREIKELIYFDALSHAADKILVRGYPAYFLPCGTVANRRQRRFRFRPRSSRLTPTGWRP